MDPEIQAQHVDNVEKIEQNKVAIDKVWAATFDWNQFLATPVGKAIGGLALALLMMMTAWVTDKINNPKNPPPPVNVNIVPAPDAPPIIPPASVKIKVVLYLTTSVKDIGSDEKVKALPITIDPKIYADGSKYPIGSNKAYDLPVAVAFGADGMAFDAVTFTNGLDVAVFLKKVNP